MSHDKDKGMVFSNTWVYSKKDTLDIHTGWWSLVNCWQEGSYETLYNVLMNINQMAVGLTAGRSDGSALLANRCINVIPRQLAFYCQHPLTSKLVVVLVIFLVHEGCAIFTFIRYHFDSQAR